MRWIVSLVAWIGIAGCGVVRQPESAKTVAAFEIPLPSGQDRVEFLSMLRATAKTDGLHVDVETKQELEQTARDIPEAEMTIHAGVWRGKNDDKSEAVVMDWHDHLGQVWIMFAKGEDAKLATNFR